MKPWLTRFTFQLLNLLQVSLSQNACSQLPGVLNAHVSEQTRKDVYQLGETILFTCDTGFTSDPKYVCSSEGWVTVRQESCYSSTASCEHPSPHEGLRIKGLPENNSLIPPGHVLIFSCDDPEKRLNGSPVLICDRNGQWDKPVPSCEDVPTCSTPPPIEDGDIMGSRTVYREGETVEYICPRYYVMEGGPQQTCRNGQWVGHIRCLKPCTVTQEVMNRHNVVAFFTRLDKIYVQHNDYFTFKCKYGNIHDGRVNMRQRCTDGVIQFPTCV